MNRKCLMANAFALAGRGDWRCLTPGVPLRSAPGYVLAAFSRRTHSYFQKWFSSKAHLLRFPNMAYRGGTGRMETGSDPIIYYYVNSG